MIIPKINLNGQTTFASHRCGWAYALDSLKPLHKSDGIRFDGFIEDTFAWNIGKSKKLGRVPIKEPWIGFIHNPPNMPLWFDYVNSPQKIFESPAWQASIEHCKGLFCLSQYHAEWLRQHVPVPVNSLLHPTDLSAPQFDLNKFVLNPDKKVLQIGYWLRKLDAICRLPTTYSKYRLWGENSRIGILIQREQANTAKLNPKFPITGITRLQSRLSNSEYDEWLTSNIVFLDLYDSSANNAIIECMARCTPLLVNRHPAIEEYLGCDYPLFYEDYNDASNILLDFDRLVAANTYLKNPAVREKLHSANFYANFANSSIYQSL